MPTPVSRRPRPYPALLNAAIRTASSVIKTCERDRVFLGNSGWVVSLLASIVSSGYAIRTLLRAGHLWDCLLLARRMHEASFDIHYILANLAHAKAIGQLYLLERDEDAYKALKAHAAVDGMTVKQLLQKRPELLEIKKKYDAAESRWKFLKERSKRTKKDRKAQAEPGRTRWRDIKWETKIADLDLSRDSRTLIAHVMHEGNAVAHARPDHIKYFSKRDTRGMLRFSYGKVRLRGWHFNPWSMPLLPLILGSGDIIDAFSLSAELQNRVKAITTDIRKHREINERRNQDQAD